MVTQWIRRANPPRSGTLLEFTDGVIAKMVPIAALRRRAVRA